VLGVSEEAPAPGVLITVSFRRIRQDERVNASIRSGEAVDARIVQREAVSASGIKSARTTRIRRLRQDERVSARLRADNG
jgi:hypothetical protein